MFTIFWSAKAPAPVGSPRCRLDSSAIIAGDILLFDFVANGQGRALTSRVEQACVLADATRALARSIANAMLPGCPTWPTLYRQGEPVVAAPKSDRTSFFPASAAGSLDNHLRSTSGNGFIFRIEEQGVAELGGGDLADCGYGSGLGRISATVRAD